MGGKEEQIDPGSARDGAAVFRDDAERLLFEEIVKARPRENDRVFTRHEAVVDAARRFLRTRRLGEGVRVRTGDDDDDDDDDDRSKQEKQEKQEKKKNKNILESTEEWQQEVPWDRQNVRDLFWGYGLLGRDAARAAGVDVADLQNEEFVNLTPKLASVNSTLLRQERYSPYSRAREKPPVRHAFRLSVLDCAVLGLWLSGELLRADDATRKGPSTEKLGDELDDILAGLDDADSPSALHYFSLKFHCAGAGLDVLTRAADLSPFLGNLGDLEISFGDGMDGLDVDGPVNPGSTTWSGPGPAALRRFVETLCRKAPKIRSYHFCSSGIGDDSLPLVRANLENSAQERRQNTEGANVRMEDELNLTDAGLGAFFREAGDHWYINDIHLDGVPGVGRLASKEIGTALMPYQNNEEVDSAAWFLLANLPAVDDECLSELGTGLCGKHLQGITLRSFPRATSAGFGAFFRSFADIAWSEGADLDFDRCDIGEAGVRALHDLCARRGDVAGGDTRLDADEDNLLSAQDTFPPGASAGAAMARPLGGTVEDLVLGIFKGAPGCSWVSFAASMSRIFGLAVVDFACLQTLIQNDANPRSVLKSKVERLLQWFQPLSISGERRIAESAKNMDNFDTGGYTMAMILEVLGTAGFHGHLSPVEAKGLLGAQPAGTYLFRFSSSPGAYTLSVTYNNIVGHWRLRCVKDFGEYPKFFIEQREYQSLQNIVATHGHDRESLRLTRVDPGQIATCFLTNPLARAGAYVDGRIDNVHQFEAAISSIRLHDCGLTDASLPLLVDIACQCEHINNIDVRFNEGLSERALNNMARELRERLPVERLYDFTVRLGDEQDTQRRLQTVVADPEKPSLRDRLWDYELQEWDFLRENSGELTSWNVEVCELSAVEVREICDALAANTNLLTVALSGRRGETCTCSPDLLSLLIVEGVARCSPLKEVQLFHMEACSRLDFMRDFLSAVQTPTVEIWGCEKLSGSEGLVTLFDYIADDEVLESGAIEKLEVSMCGLKNSDLDAICFALSTTRKLKSLNISSNEFRGEDAIAQLEGALRRNGNGAAFRKLEADGHKFGKAAKVRFAEAINAPAEISVTKSANKR